MELLGVVGSKGKSSNGGIITDLKSRWRIVRVNLKSGYAGIVARLKGNVA